MRDDNMMTELGGRVLGSMVVENAGGTLGRAHVRRLARDATPAEVARCGYRLAGEPGPCSMRIELVSGAWQHAYRPVDRHHEATVGDAAEDDRRTWRW